MLRLRRSITSMGSSSYLTAQLSVSNSSPSSHPRTFINQTPLTQENTKPGLP